MFTRGWEVHYMLLSLESSAETAEVEFSATFERMHCICWSNFVRECHGYERSDFDNWDGESRRLHKAMIAKPHLLYVFLI